VIRIAGERRDEIQASRARIRAGEARPTIASALEDPMLSPSLDHLPFMLGGADVSVTIEQRIPRAPVRWHRRRAALADLDRLRAEESRTTLDVGLDAAGAFLMVQERRRTTALINEQLAFARDVVSAVNAGYASGTAPQSDVLRAEVEVARLEAAARALVSEVRGAEAMLNTSLALDADLPVGRAEVARADAEVDVMRDMFRPMVTIRTGPSYTMTDGRGWMAMVGISLPIWRDKLRAGVAEAQAMRAMSQADLQAMTRMIDGQAATALNQWQAARDRQAALMQADLVAADTELGLAWARLGRALGSYEAIVP
jgi:cobalt-zinc-cadmium efflux system outer membrane protein